jgi:hypothetical protein
MNLKEAEQCIKDVFGEETKLFAREDFIVNRKRVLRPATDEEMAESKTNLRLLPGERLVILGEGKTWEDALRGPVSTEMQRRREVQRIHAENAAYAGERFAVFLREKFDKEYTEWITTSPLAAQMQRDFDKRMGVLTSETQQPPEAAKC